MNTRFMLVATAAALGFSTMAACSAGSDSHSSFGLGGGGSDSTGTHHPSGGDGGTGGGFASSTGSGAGCATHCSSDLHDVVDCHDHVVMQCPMGKGCGAHGCVEACDSAEQNKSSLGCDYYVLDPDVISEGSGSCFAAFIANTWDTPVTLTLERGGMALDIAGSAYLTNGSGQGITYTPLPGGQIAPGQVAIVFLAASGGVVSCPAGTTPALTIDPAVHGTGYGQAFHLVTNAPVVAYDIFPYGGGSAALTSATLLLPTSAWDTNYIGVDAYTASVVAASAGALPTMDIVAMLDGTQVTISPTAAIAGGGGVAASAMGMPVTYALAKGQVLQFSQTAELTGSAIQSNKPVGLWGGASCLNVGVNETFCDAAHQQIPPVKALGHEYVFARYRNRYVEHEETPPWRVVGAVDGTTLTYDPAPPAGAPTTLGNGQVAEFTAGDPPFTMKSQDSDHPFYVAGYMTGCSTYDPGTLQDCRGDPEFVNVVPPDQYLASYVFYTDPTYPETNLVLVRKKTHGAFSDVTLDCAGVVGGWMPVGAGGDYEYTRIDLVTGNFMGVNGCDNGRHEIHSDAPFGLTVWGWGSPQTGGFYSMAVSYAYPAGASIQPINTVVVPPTPK